MLAAAPGVAVHCAPQIVQAAGLHEFSFEKSVVEMPSLQATVPDDVSVQPSIVSAKEAAGGL